MFHPLLVPPWWNKCNSEPVAAALALRSSPSATWALLHPKVWLCSLPLTSGMQTHKKSIFRKQRAVWEGQTPPALLCEACGAVSTQPSLPHAAKMRAQVKFQVLSNPSTLLHRTAQISAANKQDQWDSARKSPRTYFSSCYAIPPEKIQKQIKKKKSLSNTVSQKALLQKS